MRLDIVWYKQNHCTCQSKIRLEWSCNMTYHTYFTCIQKQIKIFFYIKEFQCPSDQVKCADGLHCISNTGHCNGYASCKDGSDESEETCRGMYINFFFC